MSNEKEKLPTSPDWSTAPDRAEWFSIDKDGIGWYYEKMPVRNSSFWYSLTPLPFNGCAAGIYDPTNWENSLQKRPTE